MLVIYFWFSINLNPSSDNKLYILVITESTVIPDIKWQLKLEYCDHRMKMPAYRIFNKHVINYKKYIANNSWIHRRNIYNLQKMKYKQPIGHLVFYLTIPTTNINRLSDVILFPKFKTALLPKVKYFISKLNILSLSSVLTVNLSFHVCYVT